MLVQGVVGHVSRVVGDNQHIFHSDEACIQFQYERERVSLVVVGNDSFVGVCG